jgi:hypothetical protein
MAVFTTPSGVGWLDCTAMSKKTKKPRTPANQAATPQKSSRTVKPEVVDDSKTVESADRTERVPHPPEGEQSAISSSNEAESRPAVRESESRNAVTASTALDAVTARAEPVSSSEPDSADTMRTPATSVSPPSASQYQSLIPPTEDIDEAWGSDEDDETVITAPPAFLLSTAAPKPTAQEPNEPAESANSPALESEPTASIASARSSAAPTPSTSTMPIPSVVSAPHSGTEPVADSGDPVRISAPTSAAPPRFSAPAVHTASVRPSTGAPSSVRAGVPLSQRSAPGVGVSRSKAPAPVPASEGRPSRVPGSLRSSSVPQSSATASVARFEPPPVLLQQKVSDRTLTPQSPEVTSSATELTPLVVEPPLATAVNPSYETTSPAPAHPVGHVAFAAPAVPVSPISSFPTPSPRNRPLWTLLWLASMAASGTVGWLAKPTPKPVQRECGHEPTRPAARNTEEPLVHQPPEPAVVAPPSVRAGAPATAPSNTATIQAEAQVAGAGGAPATSPSSTVPIVVQTESSDRIDVLVKSNPSKVRVWKNGKEIGRTPLVIQIGRGEHRIFEVGTPAFGVRRLSINGDKTEITVNLAVPAGKQDK